MVTRLSALKIVKFQEGLSKKVESKLLEGTPRPPIGRIETPDDKEKANALRQAAGLPNHNK